MFKFSNLKYLFPLFSLILVELISFLLYSPSHLDSILKILKEDSNLIWRHKENYVGDFQGANISLDELGFRKSYNLSQWRNSKSRILIMGASPSFGWGLENKDVYSSLLNNKLKDSGVSVINASQIGYSSYQGKKLLSLIINKLNPTHVVISYVLNDLDYFRFYENQHFPDSALQSKNKTLINIKSFLTNTYTFKICQQLILRLQPPMNSKLTSKTKIIPRVTLEEYKNNYIEMIDIILKNQAKPIIIQIPVNLEDSAKLEYKNSNMHQFTLEVWKNSKNYHEMQNNISKELNIDLIDIKNEFKKHDRYLFIDKKLDPIHPNKEGHYIIYKTVLNYFQSSLGLEIIK